MRLISRIVGMFRGDSITHGTAIPAVTQINQDRIPVDLRESGAKGYLLVFFYPKAGTPLCTKQACGLRDAFEILTQAGIRVIGVSSDGPEAQTSFRKSLGLPFDLLADENGSVRNAFGVPSLLGISMRQSFLFKDGILVWKDQSASPASQAEDVLSAIRSRPG